MKIKMSVLALSSTVFLILGPSSLTAFAQNPPPGKPVALGHERSRGQTIYIGGIIFSTATDTANVQYTLHNPNEDADILITDIRVINPNGMDAELKADLLPFLDPVGSALPKTLPARNSTIVSFGQLVDQPPISPPTPTIRSQVLFTWVSASNTPILPLKIVGLEFRNRVFPDFVQVGRNTTVPYLILERGP